MRSARAELRLFKPATDSTVCCTLRMYGDDRF